MPKDNEVDEKAVLWRAPHGSGKWMHFEHEPKHLKSYEPLYSAATVAELRARIDRLAELRANDAAYIKKLDGIIEETGVRPVSCINPYEDLKAVVLALKKRADEADAAERRVGELEAAAKGAMALAWTDTREVEFDPTVILSPDQYDFSGWDYMRMEIHTPSGAWAVWPSGGKFSLYGGPNGLMCFERFSTREEAEERAYREIDRYCPTYPTAIVRKALTGADPT